MTSPLTPTGRFDDQDLVIERHFPVEIDDVWAAITESDRLARWYGTWTGDPASGAVMVTMNAEDGDVPAVEYRIRRCEPPHVLSVHATDDYGDWQLRCELTPTGDGTRLTFRHERLDPTMADKVGPGWEWYLDRLVASTLDSTPPDIERFERVYMAMATAYADLAAEMAAGLGGPSADQ